MTHNPDDPKEHAKREVHIPTEIFVAVSIHGGFETFARIEDAEEYVETGNGIWAGPFKYRVSVAPYSSIRVNP